MNLEFLKSKNAKIVFAIIAVLIVIIIVILMMLGGKNDKKESFLTCSFDKPLENILNSSQTFKFYKKDNGIKMSLNTEFSIIGDLTAYKEGIYNNVSKKLEEEYSYLSRLDYIDYKVVNENNKLSLDINYNITEESNEQVIAEYDFDFLNSSIEDIKNYFEGSGYTCQKS